MAIIKRFGKKHGLRIILFIFFICSFFGFPIPKDWEAMKNLWTSYDIWVVNNAIHPGLFLFLSSLIFFAIVVPFGRFLLKNHLGLRQKHVSKLHQFYIDVEPLISGKLPTDISSEDFDIYNATADKWATDCANYIGEFLGSAAKSRFLDRTNMMATFAHGAVNDGHNNIIRNLSRFRENLSQLIESDKWDS